jgi:hypothetical protein
MAEQPQARHTGMFVSLYACQRCPKRYQGTSQGTKGDAMTTKELRLLFYTISLDPTRPDYLEQLEKGKQIIESQEKDDK